MIPTVTWYKRWFGEEYLELYSHRDAEEALRHVDFVERVFPGRRPGAVLDLACGAGRHTEALRRRGYRTLGLDLSITLLTQPPKLPRVAGDIGTLPFRDATFDWVLNFFTSFGYFEGERENFEVLEEIRRVLAPGGRFLIDLFNRERVIAELVPEETRTIGDREVQIERWFDNETERVNKRMRIHRNGDEPKTYLESVRAYRPEEVTIGLRWAGLEASELFGDFEGEAFDRDRSPRLIIVGRKPG
jgi:SAM-dependent methyltransferase